VHGAIVERQNLPKLPEDLLPPVEDALDILFQDLRQDKESQGFVENEERWVRAGLWHRIYKENQNSWMVYASATNQLNDPDAVQHDDGSAEQEEKKDDEEEEQEQPTFEQIYMRQITNVLAEELTELKEQENLEDETRITQLVDCLQMGMNFYSELEKDLCVQGWSRENSNNKKKAAKTKGLHQALQELY
jgi:hypothetical protein